AVLALDHSGSMADSAGSAGTKTDALKRAGHLFTSLLEQRSEKMSPASADQLGLVADNDTSTQILALPPVQGSHVTDAYTALDELTPSGLTNIGGGIEQAGTMLAPPSSGRNHILVVLTDGIENQPPWLSQALPIITGKDPSLMLYSIGLGNDVDP